MRDVLMRGIGIGMILLLIPAGAAAQQGPGDLTGYLPASGEVAVWKLGDAPKNYRGDELFAMIDGGADIYREYGFRQVVSAEYEGAREKSIKVEIYEMESPAAAYGIYTFKAGVGGKALAIGQEALWEDYYLNFWKGNLLVTVIGPDPEEETVRGAVALAKAVAARIAQTGERPELARLLLREPLAFSHPKYVRGPLGVANSSIFERENIFRVREGMIGAVGDCQAFVFRYSDERESTGAYDHATTRLGVSPNFASGGVQGQRYSAVGRGNELVVIQRTGRHIAVVIGQNRDEVKSTVERLVEKLKKV
ncbi:MAG: hypothetical protein LLG97_07900 [Deltaproteobacteria bacterium]|nr:hypothetical protein [Deltaproteobacteria bacterium]